jgi:hypothetical protein
LIKDFSTTEVEKYIRDVLKAPIQKTVLEKNIVQYSTPNGYFDIYVDNDEKLLVFRYPFAVEIKLPQDKLNEWNARSALTRVLDMGGKLRMDASLDVGAGLSHGQLNRFYTIIQGEAAAFARDYLLKK